MNNTEVEIDTSSLQEFVVAFAREMNEWESAFYTEWMAHLDNYPDETTPEAMQAYNDRDRAMQSLHHTRYVAIFSRYCTPGKQTRGGPDRPLNAGSPTKYAGVDQTTFIGVDVRNTDCVKVTFQTKGLVVNYLFDFTVLKTMAGWRIDGYQYQFRGDTKWNKGII